MRIQSVLFIATLVLVSGCFRKTFSPKEYYEWSKGSESNLNREFKGNGVDFTLKYIPSELILCNELRNGILQENDLESRKKELGDLTYFNLRIGSDEQDLLMFKVNDEQEYLRRVNYYSMDFQFDIIAVCGADTVPCVLYQFENTYGVTPHVNISLAFPHQVMESNAENSISILLSDRIFDNNIIRFEYKENELSEVPELTIE